MNQTTDTIMLVRPSAFRKNEETAINNYFQAHESSDAQATTLALAEFDNLVKTLGENHIRTIVINDDGLLDTPDSIFPNNVISFHGESAILYPMFAANRQRERKLNYLGHLDKLGFQFDRLKDYTVFEDQQQFLEGTGVLILDRENKIAYCSLSERADKELLNIFCEENHFKPIAFEATQLVGGERLPIYHTNVMMALGTKFCVICLDSIQDPDQRTAVVKSLEATGKTIIPISEYQMQHFAGNILEVKSVEGKPFICMSEQAYKAFSDEQKDRLLTFGQIIHVPLYTIEKYGGGSARCMMAEVFYK